MSAMTTRRVWSLVLVLALVGAPQVADLSLRPEGHSLARAVDVSSMVVYVVLVTASLLYYFFWRIVDGNTSAWLTAGLMVVSAQGLAWSGGLAVQTGGADPGWRLVVDLVTTLVLVAFVVASTRIVMTADPAMVGIGVGAVLSLAQPVLDSTAPVLVLNLAAKWVIGALIVTLNLVVAAFLMRLEHASPWVRAELVLVTILIFLARGLAYFEESPDWVHVVTIISGSVGAAVLVRAAYLLLRRAIREQQRALRSLEQRLNELESGSRADRAQLHEVRSTISGITSASELVRRRHGLSADLRRQLEHMIENELSRLERMMSSRTVTAPTVFRVDDVIEPVILAHRAKGHPVEWQRSGVSAVGRPDDLAEVVNILVTNAWTHGGHARTRVDIRQSSQGLAEVVVTDYGPGIAGEAREQIFGWGARGPNSRGQGLGLHIARQLMRDQGGHLVLAEHEEPGATFVVGLPLPESEQEPEGRDDLPEVSGQ
jgi:signal transduction histidine kinase